MNTAEGMFNPAQSDLNMSQNAIRNVALVETLEMNTGAVVAGDSLAIGTAPSQVTLTALGCATQAYNFPAAEGTDQQVLSLDGNSGQLKWASISGVGGVTAINDLSGNVMIESITLDISNNVETNKITIELPSTKTTVDDINTLTGSVGITSTSLTVGADGNNITIDLSGSGAGVTDLNTLSGSINITSATLTVDISGNDITIELPTSSGVLDVNSLTGNVGITSGTLTIGNDVGSNSITIEFPGDVVNDVNGLNGSVTIDAGDGISVSAVNQYVTISTLPCGLAVPGVGDYGADTFTISSVSASLAATSVVLASMQVPDQPGDKQTYLVSATPTAANGGSITFLFANNMHNPSDLQIAWSIAKF